MRILLSFLFLLGSVNSWACNANTELEKVYCQLRAKGVNLPPMSDFRRNPETMQRLLLKRPAAREGIALPKVAAKKSLPARSVVAKSQVNPAPRQSKPQKAATKPAVSKNSVPALAGLRDCRLQAGEIRCPHKVFQLRDNRANRLLDPQVFSSNHAMGLVNYRGKLSDQARLNQYLADSYQRYIERMLDIGLGAVTMSYSKFYYTFDDAQKNQHDFADRFEKMYGFLKKDKQSMAVKSRYHEGMPASLAQCSDLSESLIVCDDVKVNWVYQSR